MNTDPLVPIVVDPDADVKLLIREKFKLGTYPNQTYQDWLSLAEKFTVLGSRANAAGCMIHAHRLGAPRDVDAVLAAPIVPARAAARVASLVSLPSDRYDWQDRE